MSLVKEELRAGLRRFFMPATMPQGSVSDVVRQWAEVYARYAQKAQAGDSVPSKLSPTGLGGRFSTALESSLSALWLSTTWTGASGIGSVTNIPALTPTLEMVAADLLTVTDRETALSKIVDVLHTYTTGISVTLVTSNGTTLILPII